jgi:hypothetical protein
MKGERLSSEYCEFVNTHHKLVNFNNNTNMQKINDDPSKNDSPCDIENELESCTELEDCYDDFHGCYATRFQ